MRGLENKEWDEFLVVWKNQRLELYENYVSSILLNSILLKKRNSDLIMIWSILFSGLHVKNGFWDTNTLRSLYLFLHRQGYPCFRRWIYHFVWFVGLRLWRIRRLGHIGLFSIGLRGGWMCLFWDRRVGLGLWIGFGRYGEYCFIFFFIII